MPRGALVAPLFLCTGTYECRYRGRFGLPWPHAAFVLPVHHRMRVWYRPGIFTICDSCNRTVIIHSYHRCFISGIRPVTDQPSSRFSHRPLRHWRERLIELVLFLAAFSAVMVTVAIIVILVVESSTFFEHVSLKDFLTDTQWTPLFSDAHYGIMPLVAGTRVPSGVALPVGVPLGPLICLYLSEFAP